MQSVLSYKDIREILQERHATFDDADSARHAYMVLIWRFQDKFLLDANDILIIDPPNERGVSRSRLIDLTKAAPRIYEAFVYAMVIDATTLRRWNCRCRNFNRAVSYDNMRNFVCDHCGAKYKGIYATDQYGQDITLASYDLSCMLLAVKPDD